MLYVTSSVVAKLETQQPLMAGSDLFPCYNSNFPPDFYINTCLTFFLNNLFYKNVISLLELRSSTSFTSSFYTD